MKVFSPLLLAALAVNLYGTPTLGTVTATPTTAVVGTPTEISVQASITDPSLIAGGVNLLQLNANGTATILGTLHDDGLNGDAVAGDLVFTFVATLSQPQASQVQLQVSAAFKGMLQRVKSPIVSVFFQVATAPQQSITSLAQYLQTGNIAASLNYVGPSENAAITALTQQGLNVLASILNAAVLVSSQNDLRVFQAPFITPYGTTITIVFTMVPGSGGQWIINSW